VDVSSAVSVDVVFVKNRSVVVAPLSVDVASGDVAVASVVVVSVPPPRRTNRMRRS
jgi:hypothetical protein